MVMPYVLKSNYNLNDLDMVLRLRLSCCCMTKTAVWILLAARKKPLDKERRHWTKKETTGQRKKPPKYAYSEMWFQVCKTLGFHCVCYPCRVSKDDL